MRRAGKPQVWRSEAEWQAIIERYKASGLSQAKFCRQESISPSSFYKWHKRLRESEAFIKLPAVIPETKTYQLEVELPGGTIIRIR